MASTLKKKKESPYHSDEISLEQSWAPTTFQAFQFIFIFRFLSAFYNNINDCDETFNYWEPVCMYVM